eukprot:CAMPEP_0118856896 /NCGR_PEP_ID=MMETSP1163-20130328/4209_1 /TAXON_ID=124430 /ORGANISM="Phaeomonas parva, Strain CCMP2877" /LENGTH=809 /DNA_ID=CAMNT_0006790107 /DNA_START=92 /DNA_END=2521 /DNA_ORIENTATION=-
MAQQPKTEAATTCLACTEGIPAEERVQVCPACEAEGLWTCRGCLDHYFSGVVTGAVIGSCPRVACLYHHARTVPAHRWARVVAKPDELKERHAKAARDALSFQCGSCHARRSLYLEEETANVDSLDAGLCHVLGGTAEVKAAVREYNEGGMTAEDLYALLAAKLPPLRAAAENPHGSDVVEPAEVIVDAVARCVADPERRAALQLRHLRTVPRFRTRCCRVEHCFNCRTRAWHGSQSCAEYARKANASGRVELVTCFKCDLQLTKGDGCDSVTCICGHAFSWSSRVEEMATMRRERRAESAAALRDEVCAARPGLAPTALDAALHDAAVEIMHTYEAMNHPDEDVDDWVGLASANERRRLEGAEYLSRANPEETDAALARMHGRFWRRRGVPTQALVAAAAFHERRHRGRLDIGRFGKSSMARAFVATHAESTSNGLMNFEEWRDVCTAWERHESARRYRAAHAAPTSPEWQRFERLYGGYAPALRAAVHILHTQGQPSRGSAVMPRSAVHPEASVLLGDTTVRWAQAFVRRLAASAHQAQLEDLRDVAWELLASSDVPQLQLHFDAFRERKGEVADVRGSRPLLNEAGKEAFLRALLADHGFGAHDPGEAGHAAARLWAFANGLRPADGHIEKSDLSSGASAFVAVEAVELAFAFADGGDVEAFWTARYRRTVDALVVVSGKKETASLRKHRDAPPAPQAQPLAPLDGNVCDAARTGRARRLRRRRCKEPRRAALCANVKAAVLARIQTDDEGERLTDEQWVLVEAWALHGGHDDVMTAWADATEKEFFMGFDFWDDTADDECEDRDV